MAKPKTHTVKIYLDETDLSNYVTVAVSEATHIVKIKRSDFDVDWSKAGSTIGCVNAVCAQRLGERAFPHPVKLAVFTASRAYIVDRVDAIGRPTHAVWYAHDDKLGVNLNDHIHSRDTLKSVLDMNRVVTLRPVAKRRGTFRPGSGGLVSGKARLIPTVRRAYAGRGQLKRSIAAGLIKKTRGAA